MALTLKHDGVKFLSANVLGLNVLTSLLPAMLRLRISNILGWLKSAVGASGMAEPRSVHTLSVVGTRLCECPHHLLAILKQQMAAEVFGAGHT